MHQRCSLQTISRSHSLAISLFLFPSLPFSFLSSFFLPQFFSFLSLTFILLLHYIIRSLSPFLSICTSNASVRPLLSRVCVCVCVALSESVFLLRVVFPSSESILFLAAKRTLELLLLLLKLPLNYEIVF